MKPKPSLTRLQYMFEEKFNEAILTAKDGIAWRIAHGTHPDIKHKMSDILKNLFNPIKHKKRIMAFLPLDIKCPPMAPVNEFLESNNIITSRWRFCVKCENEITDYGRLVLMFVKGTMQKRSYIAWEPMLTCVDCTGPFSDDHHYFPWIVSVDSLWDDIISDALNVCHVCLTPNSDESLCSDDCVKSLLLMQKMKNKMVGDFNTNELIEIIVERMRSAEISLYEPLLCSQCTVIRGCFMKAKGNCEKCRKIAFCAAHKREGGDHIEDEECQHFLEIWKSENFVIL